MDFKMQSNQNTDSDHPLDLLASLLMLNLIAFSSAVLMQK